MLVLHYDTIIDNTIIVEFATKPNTVTIQELQVGSLAFNSESDSESESKSCWHRDRDKLELKS